MLVKGATGVTQLQWVKELHQYINSLCPNVAILWDWSSLVLARLQHAPNLNYYWFNVEPYCINLKLYSFFLVHIPNFFSFSWFMLQLFALDIQKIINLFWKVYQIQIIVKLKQSNYSRITRCYGNEYHEPLKQAPTFSQIKDVAAMKATKEINKTIFTGMQSMTFSVLLIYWI